LRRVGCFFPLIPFEVILQFHPVPNSSRSAVRSNVLHMPHPPPCVFLWTPVFPCLPPPPNKPKFFLCPGVPLTHSSSWTLFFLPIRRAAYKGVPFPTGDKHPHFRRTHASVPAALGSPVAFFTILSLTTFQAFIPPSPVDSFPDGGPLRGQVAFHWELTCDMARRERFSRNGSPPKRQIPPPPLIFCPPISSSLRFVSSRPEPPPPKPPGSPGTSFFLPSRSAFLEVEIFIFPEAVILLFFCPQAPLVIFWSALGQIPERARLQ